MKLKFLRAVPVAKSKETPTGAYLAGQTYEVRDRHAVEVYVAHGYAVASAGETANVETLGPRGEAKAHAGPAVEIRNSKLEASPKLETEKKTTN